MKAKSIAGKSPEEIETALTASLADGFKPTLAIVFLSVKQEREAISRLLDEKGIQIFGATTDFPIGICSFETDTVRVVSLCLSLL